MSQLIKNQIPIYEIMSGAVLAFAALLLILPGFATDIIGFLLIFPFTRKLFFKKVKKKYSNQNNKISNYYYLFKNDDLSYDGCEFVDSCVVMEILIGHFKWYAISISRCMCLFYYLVRVWCNSGYALVVFEY